MKKVLGVLVLTMVLMLSSCSSRKPTVAVGMTYDEVEKALGKPSQITRGVNQLGPDEQWKERHSTAIAMLADSIFSPLRYAKPFTVGESDKQIDQQEKRDFRAWDKLNALMRSIFPGADRFTEHDLAEHLDSLYFKRVASLTNGDTSARVYPQSVETTGQLIYVTWRYPDIKTDTTYAYQFDLTITPTGIANTAPIKTYYAVHEQECITFDASSGRVVVAGYQPISVDRCK